MKIYQVDTGSINNYVSDPEAEELMRIYKGAFIVAEREVSITEAKQDRGVPVYRPDLFEVEAIRITVKIGQWEKNGYPRDTRTLSINGKIVNVEFRLVPLHDPHPGHGPYATWAVISERWQLEPPVTVHKGGMFGNP